MPSKTTPIPDTIIEVKLPFDPVNVNIILIYFYQRRWKEGEEMETCCAQWEQMVHTQPNSKLTIATGDFYS